MALAEHPYRGIPDEIRKQLTDLYNDFKDRSFFARDSPQFEFYAELGILERISGSDPHSPVEYRFTSESEWEQRVYRLDSRRPGIMQSFMPYISDFIKSFAGNTFTHVEFTKFLQGLPVHVGHPRSILFNLFQRGILIRKKGYNNEPNQYMITDRALEQFGD